MGILNEEQAIPIDTVNQLLDQHGLKNGMRRIRTGQDGKLEKSTAFRNAMKTNSYILGRTGSDALFQNGKVERPHCAFEYMSCTMIQGAGLPNIYWSYVLLHVVYLKNRMPHIALDSTPYEMLLAIKKQNWLKMYHMVFYSDLLAPIEMLYLEMRYSIKPNMLAM